MPIIKSAKKRMKQNIVRRARNFPVRSEMKTYYKNVLKLIKEGSVEEAVKILPKAFSVIDMASKKNIIHPNNAARKKSRLALALNELQEKGVAKPAEKKVAVKKEKPKAEEKVEKEEK